MIQLIQPHWKRIAGLHCQDSGEFAAVWLAHNGDNDTVHLYDACLFRVEVLAVIAEGLNARGRWIPIAWQNKEVSEELYDRGCSMCPDPSDETDAMAELVSREIWSRMSTGRFKVDKRLKEWLAEFETFNRQAQRVPRGTHPLMTATRYAMADLRNARAEKSHAMGKKTFPKLATI